MRLTVCSNVPAWPETINCPEHLFAFLCFEDFSVGPLNNCENLTAFHKARAEFWNETSLFDLPDGSKNDYSVWHQILPNHNLVKMVKSGLSAKEIEHKIDEVREFSVLASHADVIELWCDYSIKSNLLQWYLAYALPLLGVDLAKVKRSFVFDQSDGKRSPKFWNDLLLDKPDREVPVQAVSANQWASYAEYWRTASKLPKAVPPSILQHADTAIQKTFEVLSKRFPDPVTGLNNIQTRLLIAATDEWRKAYHVTADAMISGIEQNDYLSDCYLHEVLQQFSKFDPPLVEFDNMDKCLDQQVRLTADGAEKKALIQRAT